MELTLTYELTNFTQLEHEKIILLMFVSAYSLFILLQRFHQESLERTFLNLCDVRAS